MPPAIVERLAKEMVRVLRQPDVQERFSTVGGIPMEIGPKAYADFIRKENEKWGEIVRRSGAVPN
jgi:tripartite-type tricarboxylate transporter receptor subunit TctC